ncbi:MAG: tRNA-dihydrouridine synthase family protein [Candidatus Saccharimonadales bacterium]
MTVWDTLPRPFFVLAPMEAVTDVVFRQVVARAAPPDLYYSEFTNATGWVHAGDKAIRGRLVKTDQEHPIIAQIWGGEPGDMEALAQHCHSLGFDGIDINMGCPVKSAVKSGGAALIRQPDLAIAAITAAKTAGLPISVKTRLGYSRVDEWREWLTLLLQQDIAALTIHLRTKKEMSKVPAHWELMAEIVALRDEVAPHTLLIGNGDVRDRAHGLELVEQYGCDGIMIGRGVFTNPFAFARGGKWDMQQAKWDKSQASAVANPHIAHDKRELIDLLRYHLDLYDRYSPQTQRPYDTLKRFFKIYVRDFDGAGDIRDHLMHTASTDEARTVLASMSTVA